MQLIAMKRILSGLKSILAARASRKWQEVVLGFCVRVVPHIVTSTTKGHDQRPTPKPKTKPSFPMESLIAGIFGLLLGGWALDRVKQLRTEHGSVIGKQLKVK